MIEYAYCAYEGNDYIQSTTTEKNSDALTTKAKKLNHQIIMLYTLENGVYKPLLKYPNLRMPNRIKGKYLKACGFYNKQLLKNCIQKNWLKGKYNFFSTYLDRDELLRTAFSNTRRFVWEGELLEVIEKYQNQKITTPPSWDIEVKEKKCLERPNESDKIVEILPTLSTFQKSFHTRFTLHINIVADLLTINPSRLTSLDEKGLLPLSLLVLGEALANGANALKITENGMYFNVTVSNENKTHEIGINSNIGVKEALAMSVGLGNSIPPSQSQMIIKTKNNKNFVVKSDLCFGDIGEELQIWWGIDPK